MTDIVERLRENAKTIHLLVNDMTQKQMLEAADEIERLRDALNLLIPHVEHMLMKAEDAAKVNTKFIRNRLNHARAALGEGK